jgi:type VI protein secretion system component Hcp
VGDQELGPHEERADLIVSVTAYLLITTAEGKLLNSGETQPDPVRFDSVPFPGRPALNTATSPFFPIQSWSCAVAARIRIGSTTSTGKAQFDPLSVSRGADKTSTTMFADLCAGTRLKFVDLVLLNNFPGDDHPNELHEALGLGTVFVDKLSWAGAAGGDTIAETAEFDYGQIWVGYAKLDQFGQAGTFVTKGWDRVADQPL